MLKPNKCEMPHCHDLCLLFTRAFYDYFKEFKWPVGTECQKV